MSTRTVHKTVTIAISELAQPILAEIAKQVETEMLQEADLEYTEPEKNYARVITALLKALGSTRGGKYRITLENDILLCMRSK